MLLIFNIIIKHNWILHVFVLLHCALVQQKASATTLKQGEFHTFRSGLTKYSKFGFQEVRKWGIQCELVELFGQIQVIYVNDLTTFVSENPETGTTDRLNHNGIFWLDLKWQT